MLKGIPSILSPSCSKRSWRWATAMSWCWQTQFPEVCPPGERHPPRRPRHPEILDAILRFFPLDPYVEHPTVFMAVLPDDPYKPEIWPVYREIGKNMRKTACARRRSTSSPSMSGAKKAYAVVTTSEGALYANVILKKGVVS